MYFYSKRLPRNELLCEVWVYLFHVDRQLDAWPEKAERETGWFDASDAVEMVDEGGLAEIIRRLTATVPNRALTLGRRR
jgi:hypothetical protein